MVFIKRGVKGFTLIEIAIVLGVISSLTAISIPAYQSVKINTNETVARKNLISLRNGFEEYFNFSGSLDYPAALTDLTGYVDSQLAAGSRNGYIYQIDETAEEDEIYALLAIPLEEGVTGNKIFRITQRSGTINELSELPKTLAEDYDPIKWQSFRARVLGAEVKEQSFSLSWQFTNTLSRAVKGAILVVRNIRFGGFAQGAQVVYDGLIRESSKKNAAQVGLYKVGTLKKGESAVVKETFKKDKGSLRGGWWYSRSFSLYEEKDKKVQQSKKSK